MPSINFGQTVSGIFPEPTAPGVLLASYTFSTVEAGVQATLTSALQSAMPGTLVLNVFAPDLTLLASGVGSLSLTLPVAGTYKVDVVF